MQVALEASASLEVLGPASTTLPIDAMREGAATFRLRARDKLGNADLGFTARLGPKSGHITASLSLRPSVPYRTALTVGSVRPGGGTASTPADRDLFPELRAVRAGMSVVPLGLAHGLVSYLAKYPYGRTEQLEQVFLNFFLNAMDAMKRGGELSVGTEIHAASEWVAAISGTNGDSHEVLRVTIRDDGEGIRKEDIPHVFDPFFTTKDYGTGLGLSITYGIVKDHGGTISVQSSPGEGATFLIHLPLASAHVSELSAP